VARGTPLEASPLVEPQLSSTYRADGQLLRAGLELWEGEDAETRERARALRVGGETVAAGELAQDGVAAGVAFLVWHHDGLHGGGAYLSERPPASGASVRAAETIPHVKLDAFVRQFAGAHA